MYKEIKVKIRDAISNIQKIEDDLKKMRYELDQLLTSWKVSDVFDKGIIFETVLPDKTESTITVPTVRFIHGMIQDLDLSRIFGELNEVDNLQLIQTYETDLSIVTNVVFVDDNVIIIGSYLGDKLQKLQITDNIMTVKKEESIIVHDLVLLNNKDILIIVSGQRIETLYRRWINQIIQRFLSIDSGSTSQYI